MDARYAYDTYKQGLVTVTMEGREAKHIALHRLSGNTTYQNRWQEIFRHEFIMLIWLPEHGHKSSSHSSTKGVYIPPRALNDSRHCYCGLEKANPEDQKCYFCGHRLLSLIDESVQRGAIVPGLL